jgi:hypothetical protein
VSRPSESSLNADCVSSSICSFQTLSKSSLW